MSGFVLTPETPEGELVAYLKGLNLAEKEERQKLRALVGSATPSQFFLVILPFLYGARPDVQEKLRDTRGTFLIKLEGEGGGSFLLRLEGGLKTEMGEIPNPDFQVRMDVDTWRAINRREIQPQVAFFQGKIKFSGNMALAFRLVSLLRA